MEDNTWVKIYRKSIENGWLTNNKLWTFWTYCLMKANWERKEILHGNEKVILEPGQFISGRKVAAEETGLSEQSVRTCLHNLENLGNLTIKSTSKFSIVTVCNWGTYQGSDNGGLTKVSTKHQPTPNQRLTTDKNYKNIKNVKNLLEREEIFKEELRPFLNNPYDKDVLLGFYEYWTEHNKSKTKLRFELEKTWDIKKRLSTWDRRGKMMRGINASNSRSKEDIEQSAKERLKRVFNIDDSEA